MKLSTVLFVLSIVLLTSSCKDRKIQNSDNNKKYSNDLGNETSPYLLQHANNPVNWETMERKLP